MKRSLFIIILLTTMFNAFAQHTPIPLYDPPAPGNKDIEIEEERTTSDGGSAVLTNVTQPELWHFPASGDSIRPAIIICPGGGYRYQAYEHEGTEVARWLASLGYHAFVLKYRLPDETLFTDAPYIPLIDARNAILTVRKQAQTLKVDPDKTGIMGFSAGGHLAASASALYDHDIPFALSGNKVRPDFSILIYPVISMSDELTHHGSKEALLGNLPTPELINLFSLEKQVTNSTPKTFILHAADDKAVLPENTKAYAGALRNHNVPVKEVILPEGGHGFGFRKEGTAFEWTRHLAKWLNRNVKQADAKNLH